MNITTEQASIELSLVCVTRLIIVIVAEDGSGYTASLLRDNGRLLTSRVMNCNYSINTALLLNAKRN